ncbi:SDR family NAD(P)-dependent oxidoreductase [Variovorax sp. PBL-E5]|uniref:SDR family NAD(P)-dependent oxidoreductase n=1 Tax=Variovorax sp. PBL-E5 TaxID=434014 RepID=UPI001317A881|nr:SDR family oxidoreductase [Variovorax sp. PBL-E5]VTU27137.1 3-oxoacyl-[acyl-carrier-protein] reductase FabG [Variovorax sp. PBL-E5]
MKNLFDLRGERILVTGAGGAIGGATARVCAALGAELFIADLTAPTALAEELKARAASLDNTKREDVNALLKDIGEIDALIDTSGYYVKGDWLDGGDEWEALFERTMAVNVKGPVNLLRAVLPGMMKRGSGRIVLTSSMAARNAGSTLAVEPAYAASKGGLSALVRYFARQAAASGVVVNGVAPGPILTPLLLSAKQPFTVDQYPMQRLGQPEEIGWPAAFLASRGASFTTGAVLDVNGGMCFS